MSEVKIRFTFEGKKYEVTTEAYPDHVINLPDGRTLHVNMWMESYPPIPAGIKLVPYDETKGFNAIELK